MPTATVLPVPPIRVGFPVRYGLGDPEPARSSCGRPWEWSSLPPPLQVARSAAPLLGAHHLPSLWLDTPTLRGAGTCMFPLHSPHLLLLLPSPWRDGSLKPTFAPFRQAAPSSSLPPSLSSGESQQRRRAGGRLVASALAKPLCEPQFTPVQNGCPSSSYGHGLSVGR